mmetsp:Transcript_30046/g.77329  ORF Transcript_30046/g.77329 Transcript_30046/m.77329 type:complete len:212 (+) Transcript_30046:2010-2645(+)
MLFLTRRSDGSDHVLPGSFQIEGAKGRCVLNADPLQLRRHKLAGVCGELALRFLQHRRLRGTDSRHSGGRWGREPKTGNGCGVGMSHREKGHGVGRQRSPNRLPPLHRHPPSSRRGRHPHRPGPGIVTPPGLRSPRRLQRRPRLRPRCSGRVEPRPLTVSGSRGGRRAVRAGRRGRGPRRRSWGSVLQHFHLFLLLRIDGTGLSRVAVLLQ